MKAFAEWLLCPSFIVRAGRDCQGYGDDFDYAVIVAVPWLSILRWLLGSRRAPVIVKSLVAHEPMSPAHAFAGLRVIKRLGFKPEWESFRHDDHDSTRPADIPAG